MSVSYLHVCNHGYRFKRMLSWQITQYTTTTSKFNTLNTIIIIIIYSESIEKLSFIYWYWLFHNFYLHYSDDKKWYIFMYIKKKRILICILQYFFVVVRDERGLFKIAVIISSSILWSIERLSLILRFFLIVNFKVVYVYVYTGKTFHYMLMEIFWHSNF
jgi:hypothetical protein